MRVIIAGSRNIHDFALLERAILASGFDITEVVSGRCEGVDLMGERWANEHGIPIKPFPYIKEYGKLGGPARNLKMAQYGEALIALPSSVDSGTNNMVMHARNYGLKVYIHPLETTV